MGDSNIIKYPDGWWINMNDINIEKELKAMENSIEKVCTCLCHKKDIDMRHLNSCCKNMYNKYIDKDYKIDLEKYKLIQEKNEK